jgi:hypothetical protein
VNRQEAEAYARHWADDWNRRDLDAILEHFADDVTFSSPKAAQTIGAPTVHRKDTLRAYWRGALARIGSLRFAVDRVIWDPESAELSIVYDREIDGSRDRAAEVLRFGEDGLVVRGEVFYGVVP